jgi:hypothetical protein
LGKVHAEGVSSNAQHNKRLQRTGVSGPLIDNLPHDAVVARPLKRGVRSLLFAIIRAVKKYWTPSFDLYFK